MWSSPHTSQNDCSTTGRAAVGTNGRRAVSTRGDSRIAARRPYDAVARYEFNLADHLGGFS
jgi:hypothetical protein